MKSKSNSLIQKLLSNWHAKVIALVASLFIFIFYRISTQSDILIPLSVVLPDGYEIARDWPENVRIIVRGNKSAEQLKKENFKAVTDLSSFRQGQTVKGSVKVERFGEALKLSVLDFEYIPSVIEFVLEPVWDKYVPVDVKSNIIGTLPKGYFLESFIVNPQNVLIRGPRSQVEKIEKIHTESLDLAMVNTQKGVINHSLAVLAPNRFVRTIDVREVNVFAIISEKRIKRLFADIDINFIELKSDLVPRDMPKGKIELEATERFLETVRKEQIQLVVDCRDVAAPGEYTLIPRPEVPAEAKITIYEPDILKIRFERK